MKKLLAFFLLTFSIAGQNALACDEECLKEKAQADNNVTFPGYISWRYCEGIAMDFMTSAVRSLDSYRNDRFSTKYKGPLRNTKSYLAKRKEWLKECDQYLSMTGKGRIFNDEKTTQQIFASIDRVNNEFNALIEGASYSTENDAKEVMDEKIDTLFKLVDDHKTIMHLRGKYVIR